MNWLKHVNLIMLRTPGGWMGSALAPALAVGFVCWSWKILLALLVALTAVRFIQTLQRFTLAAWSVCWSTIWYEFGVWLTHSLQKHQFFFIGFLPMPELPYASISVLELCGWHLP